MSGLPLLPDTAPFLAEQIAALNRILPGTSAEQRTWLSGFLAGYQAAAGAAHPAAAAPVRKAPLTILYATESGNTEALAGAARKVAARLGFAPRVVDMADTTPADAAKAETLLVLASTWGEGEPPQRAMDFYDALMAPDAPRFDKTRFAVLALGDRAYANFCETGRRIDARLAELGGARAAERSDLDVDYEAQAEAWIGATLQEMAPAEEPDAADGASSVIHVDFARAPGAEPASRTHPFEAEITEKVNLNGSRSSSRTFHVELALAGSGIAYEPGDALGILPQNDPALVEEMLDAAGLAGDAALHEALGTRYDITTLTVPQVKAYAGLTGDKALADLAADDARTAEFVRGGRHLIDLLAAAPHRLTADQLTGLLRPLPPRLYSIASSRKAAPDEAHLLISSVEYEAHGRARKGVASMDVTDRRRVGDRLGVYLKPNPHFRLPADPAQRVIMIGPGTGIAPFRAFMQERDATGASGQTWLFFGNRHYTHDFLYQLEWQDLLKRGVLSRLDVAFSRDQPEKIYVQDRMWAARRDLYAWLQDGAALYVCGDANAMARDVNATLLRIGADQGGIDEAGAQAWLDGLRRGGRYLRDVY
jgi:sulfite reductase (NADPH) flavoprotein alpha-component